MNTLKNIGRKILWPLLAVLGLVFLVWLWWQRSKRQAVVAELRTKVEQDSIKILRAKQESAIDMDLEKAAVAKYQISLLNEQLSKNRNELEKEEKNLHELEKSISKVTDWAGLDAFNRRNR